MMSRPTKLTPETQEIIVKAVSLGATYEASANAAGISYDSFNNWMKRGEEELQRRESPRVKKDTNQWNNEQPFVEFFKAIKKAQGDRQARWLSQIEQAAQNGNWQAAAWKLERTEPENFGRHRVEITGKDGGDIKTSHRPDLSKLDPKQLKAVRDILYPDD